MQENLIQITSSGTFVIYKIDSLKNEYKKVLKMEDSFVQHDQDVFFALMDIAEEVKKHLDAGIYFCVYRNIYGVEWMTITINDHTSL